MMDAGDEHSNDDGHVESQAEYWSPSARLGARTPTAPIVRQGATRKSGALLAVAILLLAALIAVGLWLAALWARSADEPTSVEDAVASLIVTRLAGHGPVA